MPEIFRIGDVGYTRYHRGLTREHTLDRGWQPSGVGEGDWQSDSREHQQAFPAGSV